MTVSAELRRHVDGNKNSHVVYSQQEFLRTYGSAPNTGMTSEDSRCGFWIFNAKSCQHLQDYCSPFSTCTSCVAVGGCGFCSQKRSTQGGRCLAGSQSGDIGFNDSPWACTSSSNASSSDWGDKWLFSNWTKYYGQGVWDNACVETCQSQQAVLTASSGDLSLGSAAIRMAYAPGANCTWQVRPSVWPEGYILWVSLQFDVLGDRGDSLRMYQASGPGLWDLGSELGYAGCSTSRDELCYMQQSVLSGQPVLISFQSRQAGDVTWQGGAWRVSWQMLPRQAPAADKRQDSPRQSTLLCIGLALLLVPVCAAVLFVRLRCKRRWQRDAADASDAALGAQMSAQAGVDIQALERALPSCKPRRLTHLTAEATCSVCLGALEVGDEVRELPCHHHFHTACIDAWLPRSGACPVCRAQVLPSGAQALAQQVTARGSAAGRVSAEDAPAADLEAPEGNDLADDEAASGGEDMLEVTSWTASEGPPPVLEYPCTGTVLVSV